MTTTTRIAGLLLIGLLSASPALAQDDDIVTTATLKTGDVSFNFRGATIESVLDHLSRAAGFAIVTTVPLKGTVDIVSHRALTPDEAVDLLTTVLHEKGYAAIRSGRTLTIVTRDEAKQRDIPVRQGADPEGIPKNDEIVTQIIPIRYSKAAELVTNVKPLLPSYSTITANEGSNAILLTDTQANVRRVAEIITSLDKSFSEITAVRVFQLRNAEAKATATMLTNLYKQDTTAASGNNRQIPPFFRRGGDDGGDSGSSNAGSAVIQASSRVTAAADERTNSVIVAAPPQLLETIANLIETLDKSTEVLAEVRVFPLKHGNAEEMAKVIQGIFAPTTATTTGTRQNNTRFGFRGNGGFFGAFGGGGNNNGGNNSNAQGDQSPSQTVVAVADTRTNSVVVSAVSEVMTQVAGVVRELDRDPSGTKKVYMYSLKNANPQEVSTLIQDMFGKTTSSSGTGTNRNSTTNRTNTNSNANRNTGSNNNSGSRTNNR